MKTVMNNNESERVEAQSANVATVWWNDGPEEVKLDRVIAVKISPDLRFTFYGVGWAQTARHTPEETAQICAALGLQFEYVEENKKPAVVSNDYKQALFKNLKQEFEGLKFPSDYDWRTGRGMGTLWVSHNYCVRFGVTEQWIQMDKARVSALCQALGLLFQEDNPRKRVTSLVGEDGQLVVNLAAILAMARRLASGSDPKA